MFKLIIGVLIAAVVSIVVFSAVDKAISNDGTGGGDTPVQPVESTINVTIQGEVNKVGTYYVNLNATLSDLIIAAGGTTANADTRAYNLEYVLTKNQTFYIAPLYRSSETCSELPIEKVNINTASAEEIMAVKGFTIPQTRADSIVAYRTSHGDYACIEDIKLAADVGAATFERMKDYITLK